MKKAILLSTIVLAFNYALANPAFMGGITFKFGKSNSLENLGTTFKVLSSDKDKKAVVSAGASYYPWAKDKQFGIDLGVGYNVKKVNVLAGWDFVANQPAVSLGYSTAIKTNSDDQKEVIDDITIKSCKNKDK